jgi:hypothetical protein
MGQMTVVAFTGWGQETDRHKAQETGFGDLMVKAAEPAAIESVLIKRSRRAM